MWFTREGFILAVEENWNLHAYGDPLFSFEQAELEVQECETVFERTFLSVDREALHKATAKHLRALAVEEDYLSRLSGYKWL
ncbi:hypothetical protein LIER_39660 [Lithospermum erythrorhizon]|uniref:Uncharacterized protein n=1 Tax=Lithospermum erythrorhizon TaxID=34254 RepID=A0AAV3QIA9_LITER